MQLSFALKDDSVFHTVNFILKKEDGNSYVQPYTGNVDMLRRVVDELRKDDSVVSAVVVYVCSIMTQASPAVPVKNIKKEEN